MQVSERVMDFILCKQHNGGIKDFIQVEEWLEFLKKKSQWSLVET